MERLANAAHIAWDNVWAAVLFFMIGALIAVGQLLLSKEVLTWRVIVGRCVSTGGLAIAAGAALTIFPDISLVAQMGIAAMLASLGTSGLELLVRRMFGQS